MGLFRHLPGEGTGMTIETGCRRDFPWGLLCLLGAPEGGQCCALGFLKGFLGQISRELPGIGPLQIVLVPVKN